MAGEHQIIICCSSLKWPCFTSTVFEYGLSLLVSVIRDFLKYSYHNIMFYLILSSADGTGDA